MLKIFILFVLVNSAINKEIQVNLEVNLHKGWFDGYQWIVDSDSFDYPTQEKLSDAKLIVNFYGNANCMDWCEYPSLKKEIIKDFSGLQLQNEGDIQTETMKLDIQTSFDSNDEYDIGISATMNIGWDPEITGEWIREGDWNSDTMNDIIPDQADTYDQSITLVHYPLRKSDSSWKESMSSLYSYEQSYYFYSYYLDENYDYYSQYDGENWEIDDIQYYSYYYYHDPGRRVLQKNQKIETKKVFEENLMIKEMLMDKK